VSVARFAAGLVAALSLAACARPGRPIPMGGGTERTYEQALAAFRRGDFNQASLDFRRLEFELGPGDPMMPEARYYLAECSFQSGDFAGAAMGFQKVAEEFPTSRYAPLALLRAGDANLRMWRRPEVDPTPGQAALAVYQELQGRYPDSKAAARAELHIAQLNDWFAQKDYEIGTFYVHRGAYDSAIIYFKDIVATYPNSKWVPRALLRLVDSYHSIGYAVEARETCAHLRRYYPQTDGLDSRCPAETNAGAQ
jgi:outer membrane protein assembly factor BamD